MNGEKMENDDKSFRAKNGNPNFFAAEKTRNRQENRQENNVIVCLISVIFQNLKISYFFY